VELNSTHPRSFIVALIPCRRNRVVSHAKTDVSDCDTGKNRIMIYGPKDDGTYVVEFMTTEGNVLAISIPRTEAHVIRHFQERMPYGLFVPDCTGVALGGERTAQAPAAASHVLLFRHGLRTLVKGTAEVQDRPDFAWGGSISCYRCCGSRSRERQRTVCCILHRRVTANATSEAKDF
jgi:hypothetical protein